MKMNAMIKTFTSFSTDIADTVILGKGFVATKDKDKPL